MSDDDDFVTIAELQDPVRAGMLVDLLAQHGIAAQTPGLNHRSMLGFQGAYIAVRLKVPKAHADEARALVEAFSDEGDATASPADPELAPEPVAPEIASPAERAQPSGPTKLRRIVAFCAVGMTFGTGHFYVGESGSGWILLGAEIVAITLGSAWHTRAAWLAIPLLVVWDLVDGMRAVDRLRRGARLGFYTQLLLTIPVAAACIAVALLSSDWIDVTFPPQPDPYALHLEVPEPPPRPPAGDLVLVPPFPLAVQDAGVAR